MTQNCGDYIDIVDKAVALQVVRNFCLHLGIIKIKETIEGDGVKKTVYHLAKDPVPTLNWVFKNQSKTSGILT